MLMLLDMRPYAADSRFGISAGYGIGEDASFAQSSSPGGRD